MAKKKAVKNLPKKAGKPVKKKAAKKKTAAKKPAAQGGLHAGPEGLR